jgi:acetylornithine deacetylase
MDAIALTRRLVDVESITGNEAAVGAVLLQELAALGFRAEKMPVPFPAGMAAAGRERFNVYASAVKRPEVVFSTHMDTVPPFCPSREDATRIYGGPDCGGGTVARRRIARRLAVCGGRGA